MAYDLGGITDALLAAGLPVAGVSLTAEGAVQPQWTTTPTPAQEAQAAAIIADPLYSVRRRRTVRDIFVEVDALTATQQNAVWANLSAGTPPKFSTDNGINSGAIAVQWYVVQYAGLGTVPTNKAKAMVISLYCQDVPGYLRNPPFAPAIYISGDEVDPNA